MKKVNTKVRKGIDLSSIKTVETCNSLISVRKRVDGYHTIFSAHVPPINISSITCLKYISIKDKIVKLGKWPNLKEIIKLTYDEVLIFSQENPNYSIYGEKNIAPKSNFYIPEVIKNLTIRIYETINEESKLVNNIWRIFGNDEVYYEFKTDEVCDVIIPIKPLYFPFTVSNGDKDLSLEGKEIIITYDAGFLPKEIEIKNKVIKASEFYSDNTSQCPKLKSKIPRNINKIVGISEYFWKLPLKFLDTDKQLLSYDYGQLHRLIRKGTYEELPENFKTMSLCEKYVYTSSYMRNINRLMDIEYAPKELCEIVLSEPKENINKAYDRLSNILHTYSAVCL